MKFTLASALLAAVATVSAAPIEDRAVLTVDFLFHAAAASYSFSIPADGQFHNTPRPDLNVNIIDTPNINAITQCSFSTPFSAALVSMSGPDGIPQVAIGPPQPIIAVKCGTT